MTPPSTRLGPADLFTLDLRLTGPELERAWSLLSGSERERAGRQARPELRRRYVAARAGLRQVLAGYGPSAPEALTFTTGAHGKPALPGGPGFSLAHCEDLALCAVAPGREVGVDLERVRVVPEAEAIIGRWFGEGERQAWAAAGRSERAFIRLWTRREAFLKALGVGFGEDGPLRELDPDRWELFDLVPAEGHLGALIVARAERGFPLPLQPP